MEVFNALTLGLTSKKSTMKKNYLLELNFEFLLSKHMLILLLHVYLKCTSFLLLPIQLLSATICCNRNINAYKQ